MTTESTEKDNADTPAEDWVPVGIDAIEETE